MKWKQVQQYEGLYEISDTGKVKSCDRKVQRKGHLLTIKGKILTCPVDKSGYPVVNLHSNGIKKKFYVHRLVAEAFLSGSGQTVNHKDGNKANNNVENLEFCSYAENNRHAVHTGLNTVNIKDYNVSKRVAMIGDDGRIIHIFESIKIASKYTFGTKHIGCVCSGKRQTAGGYKWQFV